jgi:nucleoside-diphosphate-sugar epimerase
MKIAILGAAGSIGPVAAHELLAHGHQVRAVGRNERSLREACPGAEIFVADIAQPDQAFAAVSGTDAVLFTVGLPYPEFAQYPQLTRNALEGARKASVREFLLIGSVYPYGRAGGQRVVEDHPLTPHTRKGEARKEQLELVLRANSAELHTAALLLPDFYGPNLRNTHLSAVFEGAVSGKAAPVVGPIDAPHEFVYVPDVGPVIAELFAHLETFDGSVYHLGGAGTIVPRTMYERAYAIGGHKPRLTVVGTFLQRVLGIANPLMREMVEMGYLWSEPVVLDDAKLTRAIGPLHKTPYEDGIRAGVEAARSARKVPG